MANPRYNQPERQSGREKKLSELGSLLQMSNASQAPAIEQQQLQQRDQAAKQNMMMQFMQMMNDQQGQRQRAEQAAEQLDLGNRDLVQRGQEATGRQQGVDMNVLGALAEHGDANALKALGMRIPEYGQAQQQQHQGEVQKGVAGVLPAIQALYNKGGSDLPKALGGLQPGVNPDVWNALPWNQLNQGLTPPEAAAPAPLGSGIGAGLGGFIHGAANPATYGRLAQPLEDSMTNMGQNFWAALIGLKAQPPDTRSFDQKTQQSKAWPWQ